MKVLVFLAFLIVLPMHAQYGGSRGRYGGRSGGTMSKRPDSSSAGAVAKFDEATLSSVDKKHVRIDLPNENSMLLVRTKKTVFLQGDKEVKPEAITQGSHISVEATRDALGDFVALRIVSKDAPADKQLHQRQ